MYTGKILENIVYNDLCKRDPEFYFTIAENIPFTDSKGCKREIDNLAIHKGKKTYVIIIECKLNNRRNKAIKQLMFSRKYINNKYPNIRVFCMYVHDYNPKTNKYDIEWLTEEINKCEKKIFNFKEEEMMKNKSHIIPKSRGGKDDKNNIVMLDKRLHNAYHKLFGNKTPEEVIKYLNKVFWNNHYKITIGR